MCGQDARTTRPCGQDARTTRSCGQGARTTLRWLLSLAAFPLLAISLLGPSVVAQEPEDRPLLPETISDFDAEMKGRYAWQWKAPNGELVVLYNGDFELTLGRRRFSADDGVIWISNSADRRGKKYRVLNVYLSGRAEVRESAGTTTNDTVLLISNLRTYGEVFKSQEAHTRDSAEESDLYRRAVDDRTRIMQALEERENYATIRSPQATRSSDPLRPRPFVRYDVGSIEAAKTPSNEDVYVASGGVYFATGGGSRREVTEIRAQNAVMFPAEGATGGFLQAGELGGVVRGGAQQTPRAKIDPDQPLSDEEREEQQATAPGDDAAGEGGGGALGLDTSGIQRQVRAVYLEGDVVLSSGPRFVRASRLYYDFEVDRAIILDAVLRVDLPDRGVPLYVRADEVRQLSATEFQAANARITTSEFFTPHYHVGVERLYLRDLSRGGGGALREGSAPRSEEDDAAGGGMGNAAGMAGGGSAGAGGSTTSPFYGLAGRYELDNPTLNVQNFPILAWPHAEGYLEQTETLLKNASFGYDGDFGFTVRTAWYLFNLLGIRTPPGVDATLRLDYFSDRGPAAGINVNYETTDNYGLFRSYYISDKGVDSMIGPLRRAEWEPSSDNRGRVLWRHKEFFENDWEAWLEVSYVSDPNFLEVYERSEWFEGKEQETVAYLRRARGTEAITLLANWRLLDFVTQTEHLPDLEYRRIGDTLGDSGIVSYTEGRIGAVRYRGDDRRAFDDRRIFGLPPFANDGSTDTTFRVDGREELEYAFKLGGLNVVPFGTVRGSFWDGQPFEPGGLWRGLGQYGVRGSTTLSREYNDVRSELLDINRIRHIVKPYFLAFAGHSNVGSDRITPFDEGIETIADAHGGKIGLSQIWQTKRGGAERERSVDLVTLNLEAGAFGNQQPGEISNGYLNMFRPEDSRTRNYFAGDLTYRLSDSTAFLYEFNFDTNDRSYDRHAVAIAVERTPRLAYVFGVRHAGDIDLDYIGGGFNYKATEKHIYAVRFWHDVDNGEVGEVALSYIRKLPRWYAGFNFEYDGVDNDYRLSLSLWPEGIPEWVLGSRRFTGVTTSTGIKP